MKQRKSNIELLRIIAMFLIVAHHFSVHGGFKDFNSVVSLNKFWVQLLQLGGKIGVNVFVIISGYFLISSTRIRIKKILKFWLQLFFYSIWIYFIFIFIGNETLSIKELIKNSFPIVFERWWFASTYFVIYLLSPYLNKFLNSFDRLRYQRFILFLTILWCIIPTFTNKNFQSNMLFWFIYLYALGGYIRLYGVFDSVKAKTCILLAALTSLITFLSAVFFDVLGYKFNYFSKHATYFFDTQKLPILVISVLLFLGFLKINIEFNKVINMIASATFGVYLIHDNSYVREFLWSVLFKNASYAFSDYLIPYSILVIILVYMICTLIELLRVHLIEEKYLSLLDKISDMIEERLDKFLGFICKAM
ncbi:Surface polysaccharide O-acyltransferase, integral membrane enzyme [Streptococcus equinus]|jgi:surface polysaccharide O-acyltransferase-like enzyme|nr:Surface polysaccharide O-acyltransferase, integral membrane enzyme [Streptococcus equinus]